MNAVDSGDVPIHVMENKVKFALNEEQKKIYSEELEQLLTGRQYLVYHLQRFVESIQHLVGNQINSIMNDKQEVVQRSCYRRLVDTFNKKCLNLNEHPFVLRKLHVFVNVCEVLHRNNGQTNVELSVNDAVDHLDNYCHENLDGGYPRRIE